jgi:hypothetical protein
LKNLIIRPSFNNQSLNVGLVPKHDHHHQLFFALEWLNDGNFYWTRETASLQSDLEPLFHAIVKGLHDEMQWPGVDHRALASQCVPGYFSWCFFFSGMGHSGWSIYFFPVFSKVMLGRL